MSNHTHDVQKHGLLSFRQSTLPEWYFRDVGFVCRIRFLCVCYAAAPWEKVPLFLFKNLIYKEPLLKNLAHIYCKPPIIRAKLNLQNSANRNILEKSIMRRCRPIICQSVNQFIGWMKNFILAMFNGKFVRCGAHKGTAVCSVTKDYLSKAGLVVYSNLWNTLWQS